jgi:hypothetical protein
VMIGMCVSLYKDLSRDPLADRAQLLPPVRSPQRT